MTSRKLKEKLDELYDKYNRLDLIKPDPLQFVYRYSNPQDREIAAILSAVLAYGRVQQIEKSLSRLLAILGDSPHAFVMNFGKKHEQELKDFKHRFTSGQDIIDLLKLFKIVLKKSGTIEKFFFCGYNSCGPSKNSFFVVIIPVTITSFLLYLNFAVHFWICMLKSIMVISQRGFLIFFRGLKREVPVKD
jgi:uncharacterized protein (TIGR02757 family)